ncbi:MAG: sensor histidine kinase KdpD [Anaerolineae bacterium]
MTERDATERRPSPDALLAVAQQEQRGRLKIFLGAAPGVGKTYAMLESAQVRRREGVEVVIGVVETHGRPETEALLEGLEAIPRRGIEYKGHTLGEMDLDAILARQPRLALVDELAHTNAPGSRHPKRYQDVEEILAAGIDVYTTLNIQHLESLNDVVAQITGIRVAERIPDRLLDRADEIELIDLTPDELLQRLREGKVYVPEQAEKAIRNYFRPGNLTALRELSLRRTAQRVDDQMRTYMHAHAIPGPWPTQDRIMACIGAGPGSERLVRSAKIRADRRHAEWLAVYVETPAHYRRSDVERDRIARTLRLAEQLGGEAVTIPGENVADELVRYARSRNVSEVMIGKSDRPRWREIVSGSIVNELIRLSGHIDVYVITDEDKRASQPPARPSRRQLNGYALSALAVVVAALVARVLDDVLTLPNLSMIFLAAVLLSATMWGLGPSIFASILSIAVYDFFFVEPTYTLTVASPQDVFALIMLLVVAILTSNLAGRVRDQARAARRREARTNVLYEFSREMAASAGLEGVLRAIVRDLHESQGMDVAVFLPQGSTLQLSAIQPADATVEEQARAAATWTWQHSEATGSGTDTLPGVNWLFLPMQAAQSTVGVLGLRVEKGRSIAPDQRRLLVAMANQGAVAIERAELAGVMEETRVLAETERLRTAMLSSISHDLRTPLATISGATETLLDADAEYTPAERRDLLETIQEEAARLNRFVGNLLDMTRLESGALELNRDWVEIADVIGAALGREASFLANHRIDVDVAPNLPMLHLDFVLMEQVLVNLLDNAAKFSAAATTIRIAAQQDGKAVQVEVMDEGPGVPPDDLAKIFDKFHRVQGGDRRGAGTGLGLSICQGIIEAHGGTIEADNRASGGAVFRVTLPVNGGPPAMRQELERE